MTDINSHQIAQKVRELLSEYHGLEFTIEVIEEKIVKIDGWWQVPVRPSAWPKKTYEYYDFLAEIETELLERTQINILLSPLEPLEQQAA